MSTTMNIQDAIVDPNSDVSGTILVLDISDSTQIKEEDEEVSWLAKYAKIFYTIVK